MNDGLTAGSSQEVFPGVVHISLRYLDILFGEVAETTLEF